MSNLNKQLKRTLPILLVLSIIVGILAISFNYIYSALQAYLRGDSEGTLYYLLLGLIGVGISIYVTYTIRKRSFSQKPIPKIITTIECKNCGFKNLRKFEIGDYVFKSASNCPKCNNLMLMTSIYAEEIKK